MQFSIKEIPINEYPPPSRKEKSCAKKETKRWAELNDSPANSNESSSELKEVSKKANPKPDLLFKDSPYADKLRFMEAFCDSEYAGPIWIITMRCKKLVGKQAGEKERLDCHCKELDAQRF
jgi:hypothetical protein